MNTKIKKLSIFSIFTLVICTSCLFLNSCKSDMDEPQASGKFSYTPEQKAEIMSLAKKYEVNITLKDEIEAKQLPTMEEIEKDFQGMYVVLHKPLKLVCDKNGILRTVKMRGMSKISPATESTSGSWSGSEKSSDWNREVTCGVSWTTGTPTQPGSCTIVSGYTDRDYPNITYQQSSSSGQFLGSSTLNFSFEGTVDSGTGAYEFILKGQGSVDTNLQTGSIIF